MVRVVEIARDSLKLTIPPPSLYVYIYLYIYIHIQKKGIRENLLR